jgi:spore maturation protein CgeB
MKITIIGLSLTSSWGNGHATTYRGLISELNKKGNEILFLEHDVPWYAANRDIPNPEYCSVDLYKTFDELKHKYSEEVKNSDLVIVGSYVNGGVEIGSWVCNTAKGIKAFYDIDTPVTIARLEANDELYLSKKLIPQFDLYLSFTGGPMLQHLEKKYGSPMARALHCSFDPNTYFPETAKIVWDLGYLGTYSHDRQPPLNKLMLQAAKILNNHKFIVAGPQYPEAINWPINLQRVDHVPPHEHRKFYNSQRFTMNITRADMIKWGYSPSVRLFEAAACATPIISDNWEGLDTFFEPGIDILIAETKEDTIYYLKNITEEERKRIGQNGRRKVLQLHTAAHRAQELLNYAAELIELPQSL